MGLFGRKDKAKSESKETAKSSGETKLVKKHGVILIIDADKKVFENGFKAYKYNEGRKQIEKSSKAAAKWINPK